MCSRPTATTRTICAPKRNAPGTCYNPVSRLQACSQVVVSPRRLASLFRAKALLPGPTLMTHTRVFALALPVLLFVAVCSAIGWQIHMAIPFSAEDGPVEWLDTALLALLTTITFGIGVFQIRRRRLAWWAVALGLGVVMALSMANFFPDVIPGIDDSDYFMVGFWLIAAGLCFAVLRSALAEPPVQMAIGVGLVFHTGALIFDLLDGYLLPNSPRMAAGFLAAREIVELLYLVAYCCTAALLVGRVITDALGDP